MAAIAAYLEAVPVTVRAGSDIAIDRLLMPPARHWPSLARSARRSYWRVVRSILRADTRSTWAIVPGRDAAPAFAIARRFDGRVADALASATMMVANLPRRVARRIWRAVPAR